MLSEDDKRELLFDLYNFHNHSLAELSEFNNEYTEYVHACIDFVRYLPNWSHSDLYCFKDSKVKPELAPVWQDKKTYFLSDMDAIAYILYDSTIPTWIKADIARVYTIKCDRLCIIRMLAYNNVHMHRRKRWGLFL